MIADNSSPTDALFSRRNLLEDLISFVFSSANNKLMLVGDTAQLPPVGLDLSPALNPDYVRSLVHVSLFDFEMKEVKRQSVDSGILTTATIIREKIAEKNRIPPFFNTRNFKTDIFRIDNGYELEELLQSTYSSGEPDIGIVVCRTNKRTNLFNQQIRSHILQRETDIEGGDIMMVVRNNYFWLDERSKAGFIANGDLIRIIRIRKTEEMYGFHFADAEVEFMDYPEEKEHELKLLLDTIYTDGPGISEEERNRFFNEVEQDYMDIPARRQRIAQVMANPYYNAVHVKFAYAMTCHKTQGGQWPNVIVDQGYLNDEMINVEYLRWLYTAITRSTEKLYLVNFKHQFFAK
jgi:exodeoxyribonuclease-5